MTPIYEAIKNYIDKDISRLHMPGHKGKSIYGINNLWQYDITEIKGLDNLLNSKGIIKKTEDLYAQIYGTKQTLISTQGSTLCIQAMMTMVMGINDGCNEKKIIIDRNAHVAAINIMAILDIEPIWLYPDVQIDKFLPGIVSCDMVEKTILENLDAIAVYITSPNYFGVSCDLKSMGDICKKYGKILLVDNAHGAHFKFINDKCHPIDCGVDICCDSLHKTMPVLTGGALLHIANDKLTDNAKKIMSIYSSTSPSYLTMLSIDLCLDYICNNAKNNMEILIEKVNELRVLAKKRGFNVLDRNVDAIRLVIGTADLNCYAEEVAEKFRCAKVEPEYVDKFWIVFLFSAQNDEIDFDRIKNVINSIEKKKSKNFIDMVDTGVHFSNRRLMSIRKSIFSSSKKIKIDDALGCVTASQVVTCPPAIPIVMPGEIVSDEMIDFLKKNNIFEIDVVT